MEGEEQGKEREEEAVGLRKEAGEERKKRNALYNHNTHTHTHRLVECLGAPSFAHVQHHIIDRCISDVSGEPAGA